MYEVPMEYFENKDFWWPPCNLVTLQLLDSEPFLNIWWPMPLFFDFILVLYIGVGTIS